MRCGDAAAAQRSDNLLPDFFKKLVEVEENAVHAKNNKDVGATGKLVHFLPGSLPGHGPALVRQRDAAPNQEDAALYLQARECAGICRVAPRKGIITAGYSSDLRSRTAFQRWKAPPAQLGSSQTAQC